MLSKLLALLAKLDGPKILQLLNAFSVLLSVLGGVVPAPAGGAGGNLESVALTDEDNANIEKISQALSACPPAEGGTASGAITQQAFDIQKIIALVRLLRSLLGQ